MKKLSRKLIKDFIKRKPGLTAGISFITILLSLGIIFLLRKVQPEKMPELFPVESGYQAYYEINVGADLASLTAGQEVVIDVYITTSGEEFDAAVALLEWNEGDFFYKSANGALSSQFLSSFVQGDQGRRIMTHFTPKGDQAMRLGANQKTKFATLVLAANVNNPVSQIKLSSKTDDLAVHFVDSGAANSVNQSLAAAVIQPQEEKQAEEEVQSGFMKIMDSTVSQPEPQPVSGESEDEVVSLVETELAEEELGATEREVEVFTDKDAKPNFKDKVLSFLRPKSKEEILRQSSGQAEKEGAEEITIERQRVGFWARIVGFFQDFFGKLFK